MNETLKVVKKCKIHQLRGYQGIPGAGNLMKNFSRWLGFDKFLQFALELPGGNGNARNSLRPEAHNQSPELQCWSWFSCCVECQSCFTTIGDLSSPASKTLIGYIPTDVIAYEETLVRKIYRMERAR